MPTKQEQPLQAELEFQPRALPIQKLDRRGLCGYLVFLVVFLWVMFDGRSSSVYYFVAMCRDIFKHDHFVRISSWDEYYQWFGLHFLVGMRQYSFGAAEDRTYALVGAPRIVSSNVCVSSIPISVSNICLEIRQMPDSFSAQWQVQASDCTAEGYMDAFTTGCIQSVTEQKPFGGPNGTLYSFHDGLGSMPQYVCSSHRLAFLPYLLAMKPSLTNIDFYHSHLSLDTFTRPVAIHCQIRTFVPFCSTRPTERARVQNSTRFRIATWTQMRCKP